MSSKPILEVQDLSISFTQYEIGLRQRELKVVNHLDIDIGKGEIMAVVGSSGSGKSLLAHAILGILPNNAQISGTIYYHGELLTKKRQADLRGREITLIPQSVNYLDPLMKVGAQVRASIHNGDKELMQKGLFKRYGLDEKTKDLFPFQLSGGMARRVLVANAVANNAGLIIADEPTPGLHPEVVEQTLKHLRELADLGCAVMLITHDIQTSLDIADRIAVLYAGTTIEVAPSKNFCGRGEKLKHPYTRALWRALPQNDFTPIPGFQPLPNELPKGCVFEPRCEIKTEKCRIKEPELCDYQSGKVRCYHAT